MPCMVKILDENGTLKDAPYTGDSLADTAKFEPQGGVYTITNTNERFKVLKLGAHLDRLEDSARRADIVLTLNRPQLQQALRDMISEADWGDVRFRVTVDKHAPTQLILSIEPFKPISPLLLENGTRCITAPNSARSNPEAKTTDWMHYREALQNAMPEGIYDTFLMDEHAHILEGLGSNFYAIVDDTLRTADKCVLKGISRQVVLEIAPALLPIQLEAVFAKDIAHFNEAFLSSSSRGIVPVVEIDGVVIGDGKVGTITKQLRQAYSAWMQTHLEEL